MQRLISVYLMLIGFHTYPQVSKIDSLSKEVSKSKNDTSYIINLNELAYEYLHFEPAVAKDDVNIALHASRDIQYLAGEGRALNVLGSINWTLGNYDEALKYYFESLGKYELLDDQINMSKALNNIGEIYKKLNDWDQSLVYHLKALEIKRKVLKEGIASYSYINIGEIHIHQGNYDSAILLFDEVLRHNSPNTKLAAYAYNGLGDIFFNQGNYTKSLSNYRKALVARKSIKDERGIGLSLLNIGKVHNKLDDKDSSNIYYTKAINSTFLSGARDIRMSIYHEKSQLDSLEGNIPGAYENVKKYYTIKDSLFNEEKSKQIARMQTHYETELLQKDNRTKSIQLEERNIIILAIIMLVFLTGALARAFYKQRQTQISANHELLSKNEKIENQQKEILAKSRELKSLNEDLASLNKNLEKRIKDRTQQLKEQNRILGEYAFINAHALRAPVASVLGLVSLLESSNLAQEDKEIVEYLKRATGELDNVIIGIRTKLSDKIDQ